MVPETTTNPLILVTHNSFDLRMILQMMDAVFFSGRRSLAYLESSKFSLSVAIDRADGAAI
jgi:hypothetical protein